MTLVRYRCPEDGIEYDTRDDQLRCPHPREAWEEIRYVPEQEVFHWQTEVATLRGTLDGLLNGTVVLDKTEDSQPILLDLTPDPARVVWPR
ncbi:MAG: hypothetical protein WBP93_16810 [Pyrinomonadaceae bacterium]